MTTLNININNIYVVLRFGMIGYGIYKLDDTVNIDATIEELLNLFFSNIEDIKKVKKISFFPENIKYEDPRRIFYNINDYKTKTLKELNALNNLDSDNNLKIIFYDY